MALLYTAVLLCCLQSAFSLAANENAIREALALSINEIHSRHQVVPMNTNVQLWPGELPIEGPEPPLRSEMPPAANQNLNPNLALAQSVSEPDVMVVGPAETAPTERVTRMRVAVPVAQNPWPVDQQIPETRPKDPTKEGSGFFEALRRAAEGPSLEPSFVIPVAHINEVQPPVDMPPAVADKKPEIIPQIPQDNAVAADQVKSFSTEEIAPVVQPMVQPPVDMPSVVADKKPEIIPQIPQDNTGAAAQFKSFSTEEIAPVVQPMVQPPVDMPPLVADMKPEIIPQIPQDNTGAAAQVKSFSTEEIAPVVQPMVRENVAPWSQRGMARSQNRRVQRPRCPFQVNFSRMPRLTLSLNEFDREYLLPALNIHVIGGPCRTMQLNTYLNRLLRLRRMLYNI